MEPTIPLSSKVILVVAEDEQERNTISLILQIENYQVLKASNGEEALFILENNVPELILSDINMPRLNGIEFFTRVRNDIRLSGIPFVFLTNQEAVNSHKAIMEMGVEDWVAKPISPDRLTHTINARLLRAAEVKIAHIDQAYLETVEVLANAVEGRDRYTRGHIERVTTYALWIAEELRWPAENIRILTFGARLHDIGKIIVPDHILNKPERLSPEEWDLMMNHPTAGAKMLQKINHLEEVIPYILYHHEKWNGEGYPNGLKEREIPLGARILALADVYDALTTARPYRPALPREEVMNLLSIQSGKHFDPDLVPIFTQAVIKRSKTHPNQKSFI